MGHLELGTILLCLNLIFILLTYVWFIEEWKKFRSAKFEFALTQQTHWDEYFRIKRDAKICAICRKDLHLENEDCLQTEKEVNPKKLLEVA